MKSDDVNRTIEQMTTNRSSLRVKQLAEQAWIETKEEFDSIVDDGGSINFTFAHAYDQKFAELIVRECANVALREDHEPDECILRHFGVKR